MRTDSDTEKHGYITEQILEIATDVKLRDRYNLDDRDLVEVEIESGRIVRI